MNIWLIIGAAGALTLVARVTRSASASSKLLLLVVAIIVVVIFKEAVMDALGHLGTTVGNTIDSPTTITGGHTSSGWGTH